MQGQRHSQQLLAFIVIQLQLQVPFSIHQTAEDIMVLDDLCQVEVEFGCWTGLKVAHTA